MYYPNFNILFFSGQYATYFDPKRSMLYKYNPKYFFFKKKFVCITMLCKNVVIFTSLSQYNCWKLNILCTYISFFKKFRQNDVEFFSPWNQSKLMKKHNNKEIQPKNNLVVKPPQSIWCNHDHLFSPKRIFKIHVLLLCSCHRCLEYFLN